MRDMIGLVFAMEEEAKPVVEKLGLKKKEIMGRVYYTNTEGCKGVGYLATISGVGKVNAMIATSILINTGCTKIVNIGTCGSIGNHSVGDLVIPNVFFDGDFDLSAFDQTTKDPALANEELMKGAELRVPVPCYTYSTFVTDKRAEGSIVDMEAYGIKALCNAIKVPFLAYKVVSDGGDEDAVDSFNEQVNSVICRHVDRIIKDIENFDETYREVYSFHMRGGLE